MPCPYHCPTSAPTFPRRCSEGALELPTSPQGLSFPPAHWPPTPLAAGPSPSLTLSLFPNLLPPRAPDQSLSGLPSSSSWVSLSQFTHSQDVSRISVRVSRVRSYRWLTGYESEVFRQRSDAGAKGSNQRASLAQGCSEACPHECPGCPGRGGMGWGGLRHRFPNSGDDKTLSPLPHFGKGCPQANGFQSQQGQPRRLSGRLGCVLDTVRHRPLIATFPPKPIPAPGRPASPASQLKLVNNCLLIQARGLSQGPSEPHRHHSKAFILVSFSLTAF